MSEFTRISCFKNFEWIFREHLFKQTVTNLLLHELKKIIMYLIITIMAYENRYIELVCT